MKDVRTPHQETEALCEEVIWWHNQMYGLNLTLADIRAKIRIAPVVQARADCMYRIRRVKGWSASRIGQWFGGMDHTTVLHHLCRKDVATKPIKNMLNTSVLELLLRAEHNRNRKLRYQVGKSEAKTGVTA